MLIKFKENDMKVWPDEDEDYDNEKLHTLSDRDVKVWEYFVAIIAFGITAFLVLSLFD